VADRKGPLEGVGMSLSFAHSFRRRAVFVTGHTGFKGSWLSLWLHGLGARVTGYSLDPPTDPSNFVSSRLGEIPIRSHVADLRDFAALRLALESCQPDLVFHLAAQSLVRRSYLESRETFEVNVIGTVNVLEAVRAVGRPCTVIVVTSDKCYENFNHQQSHRESDSLGGGDPYSASKAAAEIITSCYRRSIFATTNPAAQGVKLASVRAGNVIGGGDWASDRIVPDAVRALSIGHPVPVRNQASIRPWQHVLDCLSGYLTLAARMLESDDTSLCDGWNFGPAAENEATVGELVAVFCQAWGNGKWQSANTANELHEEHALRLSSSKAELQLRWQPRWHFNEAVERTAHWYRRFYENPGRSTRALCERDISDYEAAVLAQADIRPLVERTESDHLSNGILR
jgi:CDP-glucose 4,6-dehydratase